MPRNRVLIVEDDKDILQLLTYNLQAAGYDVSSAGDGNAALAQARQNLPDIVLLDIMIPGINGFEVCKELKRSRDTRKVPVIMLTARGDEVDRVVGLELGADDYVVKPFSPRELILRIGAVLRRSMSEEVETSWRNDRLFIDFEAHKVEVDGVEIALTATEFKLLAELVRNIGKARSRDHLLDRVWAYRFEGYARTVDTHVRRLRRKLGVPEWIETVRGVGYRFKG